MNYSKNHPSEAYLKNIAFYKKMHEEGFKTKNKFISKNEAYDGGSTRPFVKLINQIIKINNCKNLMDYGCGKAKYYHQEFKTDKGNYPSLKDYWGINICLYDPCVEKYNKLIKDKVDITICIDVLEHIPSQDISWVLKDFFSLTNKIVFINVACYEAKAILPNGENAHINVQTYDWWEKILIDCALEFKGIKIIAFCNFIIENDKKIYKCIEINDKYKNYS